MKNVIKILLSLLLVVSFNSCEDSNNTIDQVFQFETGAVLRTLEVISNTLNSSDASSFWSVSVEEQDKEEGALLQSVDVYVSIRDLSPDNGTTVADDILIKTIDGSSFSTDTPFGLPRAVISATFGEAEAAMGLNSSSHAPGDLFVFELRLNLTDGRIYGADSAASIITGGYFSSPFSYNALILCSPEPGDYLVDMHDSYGDGWQTDSGSGGNGLQVTADGTVLQVGMCSPYGAGWLGAGESEGCITGDYYDASDVITIPNGTQEAVWNWPGDAYGEISFEVYAPDGSLVFEGLQGATAPGLMPIAVCASS